MRLHLLICAVALAVFTIPAYPQGTLGGGGTTPGSIGAGPGLVAGGTGASFSYGRRRRFPSPQSPGLFEIRIPTTPTGFAERFLLQVPTVYTGRGTPLLVAFHRFSNTMYDIPINTDLCAEADARGWYLLAPLGLSDEHFNSVPSQINTELVLELVTRIYNIDMDRIYGVGHSMGGGAVVNYAARHLDPDKPMMAAVINHTGVMSQAHSRNHFCTQIGFCDPANPANWDFWYGGSPMTNGFDYSRSSVIDLPYVVGLPSIPAANQQTDLARNLTHIPMQSWMAEFDPLQELLIQNYAFEQQMLIRGGDHTLITLPSNVHVWDTLDYTVALDFMASKTLTFPTSAMTIADQNGKFFYFGVTQTTTNVLSPFTWSIDNGLNMLSITSTINISILDVDVALAELGVRPTQVLTVDVQAQDGSADLIRLNGVFTSPSSVTRDGMPDSSWTYSAIEDSLEFQDTDGGLHQWIFSF